MVGFWKYLIPKDVNAMLKSILVTTANGKPQTASSRLPFAVNAMLKVSIREFKKTPTAAATATSLNKRLSRTIAVHVRYNSLYISWLSSAKQQH